MKVPTCKGWERKIHPRGFVLQNQRASKWGDVRTQWNGWNIRHRARNCRALPQQMNRSYSSWCLHSYTHRLIINQARVVNSEDRRGVNLTGESWGQMKAHVQMKDERGPQTPGPMCCTCIYIKVREKQSALALVSNLWPLDAVSKWSTTKTEITILFGINNWSPQSLTCVSNIRQVWTSKRDCGESPRDYCTWHWVWGSKEGCYFLRVCLFWFTCLNREVI